MMFIDSSFFKSEESLNPKAGQMFVKSLNKFKEKAKLCVEKSKEKAYEPEEKSSINFTKNNKFQEVIMSKLVGQEGEQDLNDRVSDFKNWFYNNFMEMIKKNQEN